MAALDAYAACRDKLQAVFGGTPPVIDWEATRHDLEQGEASFIALEDDFGGETVESLGTPGQNLYLEAGAITAHIFTNSTGSADVARALGDSVRAAIRDTSISSPSDVRFRTVGPPIPEIWEAGNWHHFTVSIDYERRINA